MNPGPVRIGGASGAWGDSPMAIGQLLTADVDYLMMDYLAEVTMALLARARLKSANAGYPEDFVAYLTPHLGTLASRGVKVVSNGGGVNPVACKEALEAACQAAGVHLKVAVVTGDDVLPIVAALRQEGCTDTATGAPIPDGLLSANAYLGALPIAAALHEGADIVVTGRCADSALALGILMHEFGWAPTDYDLLAAGSLVGHLLECGPQSTGGLFTDWESVEGWHHIGYPIAACMPDGSFTLGKPPGTGGLVSPASVAEQVLYEIGDPAAYLLPDVTADFSHVRVEATGPERVKVSGARGRPPTDSYKVCATYPDGYRAVGLISIVGVDAARKAERTAQALVQRALDQFAARGMPAFKGVHVEVLGAEASYGSQSRARHCREVLLRLVVDHDSAAALKLFANEFGSAGLSFAPGTTGIPGGRPKAMPLVKLCTFFVKKRRLEAARVQIANRAPHPVELPAGSSAGAATDPVRQTLLPTAAAAEVGPCVEARLIDVAHARSGDKGDSSNVAIFCRKPDYMPYLSTVLTTERLARHFAEVAQGPVSRFEAPGLHAFNFVIENALGGGGMASPRIDPQGKAYGQRALEMIIPVPAAWNVADINKNQDGDSE